MNDIKINITTDSSIDELVKQSEKLKLNIEATYKSLKEMGDKVSDKDVEQLEKKIKLHKQYQEIIEKSKINEAKLIQETEKANQQAIKTEKQNYDLKNKIAKDQERITKKQEDELEKQKRSLRGLSVELRELRAQYDRLSEAERNNVQVGGKLLQKIQQLDTQTKQLQYSTGRFQANVGNYKSALEGIGAVAGSVGLAFSWVAIVAQAFQVLSRAFNQFNSVNTDFEASMSNLNAVSDLTEKQFNDLKNQAIELGAATKYTASEIVSLQTELSKLGFTAQEIIDATPGIQNFASALDIGLGDAAALTGATLRMFGKDAKETAHVVDVLSMAANASALDFASLQTALPYIGATANNAGVSIERLGALMGTLANNGIQASTIGTSLRDIFLDLSKNGLTWEEAMNKINSATDKNKAAFELFGKTSATAAVILATNGANIVDLQNQLINSSEGLGAATIMAGKQLNNLKGDLIILSSAWEGLLLKIGQQSQFAEKIQRPLVQLLTKFISLLGDGSKKGENFRKILFPLYDIFRAMFEPVRIIFKVFQDIFSIFGSGVDKGQAFANVLNILTIPLKVITAIIKTISLPVKVVAVLISELTKSLAEGAEKAGWFGKIFQGLTKPFSDVYNWFQKITTSLVDNVKWIGAMVQGIQDFFNWIGRTQNALDKMTTAQKEFERFRKEKPQQVIDKNQEEQTKQTIDVLAQYRKKQELELQEFILNIRRRTDISELQQDQLIIEKKIQQQEQLIRFLSTRQKQYRKEYIDAELEIIQQEDEFSQYKKKRYEADLRNFQEQQKAKTIENENYIAKLEYQLAKEIKQYREAGLIEEQINEKTALQVYEIEYQKLQQKIELQKAYIDFLRQNDVGEEEIKQQETALIDLETQVLKLKKNLQQEAKKDEFSLLKMLGLDEENVKTAYNQFQELYSAFQSYQNAILDEKKKNIDGQIEELNRLNNAETQSVDNLKTRLEEENKLRANNAQNNAANIENEIALRQRNIEERKKQEEQLLAKQQEIEKQRKDMQKRALWFQFAADEAGAISKMLLWAFSNPLNAINPATAFIQIAGQTAVIAANFIKTRAMIKQLKHGEVDIDQGSGTKDDVPALLMRGESVITTQGTKRAKNTLRALNRNASIQDILQSIRQDFGLEVVKQNNMNVQMSINELLEQNKILENQNNKLQENNNLLKKLVNKEVVQYIPTKNGYIIKKDNSITEVKIEQ